MNGCEVQVWGEKGIGGDKWETDVPSMWRSWPSSKCVQSKESQSLENWDFVQAKQQTILSLKTQPLEKQGETY